MKEKLINVNIVNVKQQQRAISGSMFSHCMKIKKKCQYCEYKATQKSSLKTHIQSIHERITYQCQYCEFKATQKSSLKTHIQSIHEGKT